MSRPQSDPLALKTVDGVAVVTLTDNRLDDSNVQGIGDKLAALVDDMGGQQRLHLDLSNVRYVSSMGLAKLVSLYKKLRAGGRQLTLCNVEDGVYEAFQVTNLTALLDVRPRESA